MAQKRLRRGIFITFEGVEGCGKSTHSRLAYNFLKRKGYPCVYTKEPGGTAIGERIREILLDPENKSLNDITELFLFEANRSQIVEEVIRPSLKQKMIVISDRFFDATTAYQGYGNRLNKITIKNMNTLATGGLKPDLTIILDIETKKGLGKARQKKRDRMEEKPLSYHNRVRKGYMSIARNEPRRIRVIPTKKRTKATQELVNHAVLDVIQRYKISK